MEFARPIEVEYCVERSRMSRVGQLVRMSVLVASTLQPVKEELVVNQRIIRAKFPAEMKNVLLPLSCTP